MTYWPLMLSFFREPEKKSTQWGLIAEGLFKLDQYIGTLMDRLVELGIAENTLIVATPTTDP